MDVNELIFKNEKNDSGVITINIQWQVKDVGSHYEIKVTRSSFIYLSMISNNVICWNVIQLPSKFSLLVLIFLLL